MAELDKHLRDLVDAAEPAVRLADPGAVRSRAKRRTARRRAAAAGSSVFTTAALAFACWQLPPAGTAAEPDRHIPAQAPSPVPVPTPLGIDTGALLPPTGLLADAAARWKATGTSTESGQPLLAPNGHCPVVQPGSPPLPRSAAQASRDYLSSSSGATARHALARYPDESSAAAAFSALERTLRGRCGLAWAAVGSVSLYSSAADGSRPDIQIMVTRSGTFLSIVHMEGPDLFTRGHLDHPAVWCMRLSLGRLDPAATAPPMHPDARTAREQRRC